MKKADLITGFVLLALAGYVIWESSQMPQSATFGPGVGFLPLWLGILLAFFSIILIAGAWFRKTAGQVKGPLFPEKKALLAVVLVLVGLAAYILLIEVIGFIADTFLFVTFLMWFVERQKWLRTIATAVLTTGGLYIIFEILLKITLPSNMFGF
jgi:putative tricarboxylic transport membrane protein